MRTSGITSQSVILLLSVSRGRAAMALNAKTDPNYVPKRINGKFAPGYSGNPGGSLEATRRSFNKDFLLALAADFKKHGAAAIEKVRKTQPARTAERMPSANTSATPTGEVPAVMD